MHKQGWRGGESGCRRPLILITDLGRFIREFACFFGFLSGKTTIPDDNIGQESTT